MANLERRLKLVEEAAILRVRELNLQLKLVVSNLFVFIICVKQKKFVFASIAEKAVMNDWTEKTNWGHSERMCCQLTLSPPLDSSSNIFL